MNKESFSKLIDVIGDEKRIFVSAPPAMGRETFAINLALNLIMTKNANIYLKLEGPPYNSRLIERIKNMYFDMNFEPPSSYLLIKPVGVFLLIKLIGNTETKGNNCFLIKVTKRIDKKNVSINLIRPSYYDRKSTNFGDIGDTIAYVYVNQEQISQITYQAKHIYPRDIRFIEE